LDEDEDRGIELRLHVKKQLRERMRAVRRTLPARARDARSAAASERVIALDAFVSARVVAVYVALRTELDPSAVVVAARAASKIVCAPRVDADENRLRLHRWDEADVLATGPLGLREPLAGAPEIDASEVDLVLVPALAIDERGHRLGYGAGYYDRLLPSLARATRVGIAFDFQLVPELPDTAGDERLDIVVTDKRAFTIDSGAARP